MEPAYLSAVGIISDRVVGTDYPFNLPLIRELSLRFEAPVTFFVGENGTGKSTVLEAIAALCGLPVSGGGRAELAERHGPEEESKLADALRPTFRRRPPDAYFLRSEFQSSFATLLDKRSADPDFRLFGDDPYESYGGQSLFSRSHGEAFLAILENRFRTGLFLLDEPEAALSPQRQLALLAHVLHCCENGGAQFIMATHSPILLTYPGSTIFAFDGPRVRTVDITETSHYQITRGILQDSASYWRHLGGKK
jgi:predicted ATPase